MPEDTKASVSVPQRQTTFNREMAALYAIIIIVLGLALIFSLSLGKDYMAFSSSIVTALTTIAGFVVGTNATSNK